LIDSDDVGEIQRLEFLVIGDVEENRTGIYDSPRRFCASFRDHRRKLLDLATDCNIHEQTQFKTGGG